jgi:hypothetical protein
VQKRKIRILRVALLLLICVGVTALMFLVVLPTRKTWAYARWLSDAMLNARSVTIVEFERYLWTDRELIFQRVEASPSQIEALRVATGGWIAMKSFLQTMCFNPHHRIEVVRADGSKLQFDICFHCNNFVMGDSRASMIPASWRSGLESFFREAGMPPREDYSERAKQHPEYPALQEQIRAIDAEMVGRGSKQQDSPRL